MCEYLTMFKLFYVSVARNIIVVLSGSLLQYFSCLIIRSFVAVILSYYSMAMCENIFVILL